MYAICVGWVNFVHSLRCLLKNLRSQQKFYATAGPTGPDKYELCELLEDIEDGSEGLEVNRHLYPADDNEDKVMFYGQFALA